ncbi:hypothetical protein BSLG_004339 [Batrachochytrium salamandrivorans]|nr:hypothetical protein BSLG_004339 [Batrachochytrium salamandrivorans]
MEKRLISNEVDLAQMPSIMQAMGFYPSNQEIDDMINEVKFSKFVHGKGEEVSTLTLLDLIKRESLSFEDVQKAFYQLLVDKPPYYGKLPRTINAHSFIQDILGLSPVNSNDTANHGVDPNAISEIPPTLA